jgi:hypothetical protein
MPSKRIILDTILAEVLGIKRKMATKPDLARVEGKVDGLSNQIEGIATQVKKLVDDKPFTDRRLSRVEFRTEKLLGPKVQAADAEFEEQRHLG